MPEPDTEGEVQEIELKITSVSYVTTWKKPEEDVVTNSLNVMDRDSEIPTPALSKEGERKVMEGAAMTNEGTERRMKRKNK